MKYYGKSIGQSFDDPLSSVTTSIHHGVVNVRYLGNPASIADIGMRMLKPHEAAAAHELTLPESIVIDGVARPLTVAESMRLIGNSVPKRMAMLLAQANNVTAIYGPQAQRRRVA